MPNGRYADAPCFPTLAPHTQRHNEMSSKWCVLKAKPSAAGH